MTQEDTGDPFGNLISAELHSPKAKAFKIYLCQTRLWSDYNPALYACLRGCRAAFDSSKAKQFVSYDIVPEVSLC